MKRITKAHIFVWRAMPAIQCALRLFDSFNSETTKINYQFLNDFKFSTRFDILSSSYHYQRNSIFFSFQNAINVYTKDGFDDFLKENQPISTKHVLIFHCEFSSKRGPKLCRFLRNRDREMNKENYPKLNFPEMYLLEGGYKGFFESNSDLCFPQAYKPMLDKRHLSDLRHFRVKSKSWAAGDKPRYERNGLQRMKLSFN